jgi:radical SAM superfamily enzyme YgiQ (UPF0313 family)
VGKTVKKKPRHKTPKANPPAGDKTSLSTIPRHYDKSILMCFYPMPVKWNHGIALISALCKDAGVRVDLLVLDNGDDMCISAIHDYPGDHIGFSCVTGHDYRLCVPYMAHAKASGHTVLLGGIWAGLGHPVSPDVDVDYVCRGDGESLVGYLTHGDTAVFDSPQVCEDLDSLPIPDYELFRELPFIRNIPVLFGKYALPYVSSRGCPYRCEFCQVSLQQPSHPRIRHQVARDLSYLADKYHPDVFVLADALLPYYNASWRDSWEGFNFPFVCYIRGDATPWELAWLVSHGMIGCAFGVESGDEGFRNGVLGKGLTDRDLFRTVGILNTMGVEYVPFYMSGVPGGDFLEATNTFKMYHGLGGYPIMWEYENLMAMVSGG